jgi:signal transduction histidine kinase
MRMATPFPVPEPSRTLEVARLELARFAPDAPLDRVFRRACELSAHALDVERVGVWLFIDDRTVLRCASLYERSKGESSGGALLQVADFPTYFASLAIRKAIPAEVAASEPWTAELASKYLQPLGITSMLDAGIFVDGALVGVICHEHVGAPREWTTEARDFAGSIADLLALRIKSAEVRDLRAAFQTEQERLASQEKNAALEQLAAGVAHDFKNLLGIMLGQGELLSIRQDLPANARQQAKAIVTAAERGMALAEELLEFARPVQPPPAVIDVVETTAAILPVLQSAVGTRHELRYTHDAVVGQVLIDKSKFTRLLLNLVVNASEALPDGGAIDIQFSAMKLVGRADDAGHCVLLEVRDQGVGMEESTRRRAFEPFFSTKSKGTGLGLAIVRQIVDRIGGFVRMASEPGKGTTVRLFLPRIAASSGKKS